MEPLRLADGAATADEGGLVSALRLSGRGLAASKATADPPRPFGAASSR
ncbi:protein of unknown function (plasmid) [Cupriavidus neocaledonicus]|uniref:Uncharacterized protein n=1 Tax=Cupriavidus neocaledonicus TaxID=1040979 RepID=A0A375HR11_9BURK|nr:protein of unknown function [Cupriavidus neocaledonicus]